IGDKVLIRMTDIIHEVIRPTDVLARWGGDEFVILMGADSKVAFASAERIRIALSERTVFNDLGIQASMTVSMGVSSVRDDDELKSVVQRADAALYQSKGSGKNRVVILE
ncbi:hypothetical protein TPSD3_12560, partial [Thioflexithrix psekupsensis]